MARLTLVLLILSVQLYSHSQSMKVKVIEKDLGEIIPFSTATVEYTDSVVMDITDMNGKYDFKSLSYPKKIKANGFGMEENSVFISNRLNRILILELNPGQFFG